MTDADVAKLAALKCEVFDGSLTVRGRGASGLSTLQGLESIREVTGTFQMNNSDGPLADVSGLKGLETVGQVFTITQSTNLTSVELPALQTVGGAFALTVLSKVTSIQLPALKSAGGDCAITFVTAVPSVQMDALETIGGTLNIAGNDKLRTLNGLPSLVQVGAGEVLNILNNPKLPQCEVDAIAQRTHTACSLCTGNDTTGSCN